MSIERQAPQKEENRLQQLQEAIINSPQSIEEEFLRTANDWLSCFGSRVFVIETYLSSSKVKALLTQEQYARAEKRMEDLKERLHELRERYPNKEKIPPEDIKQELLRGLDILRQGD